MIEKASSGPRQAPETRSGAPRRRDRNRANVVRQGSQPLPRNHIEMTMGPAAHVADQGIKHSVAASWRLGNQPCTLWTIAPALNDDRPTERSRLRRNTADATVAAVIFSKPKSSVGTRDDAPRAYIRFRQREFGDDSCGCDAANLASNTDAVTFREP